MIKAVITHRTKGKTVFLGLSRENCERLLDNQPIPVRLADLDADLEGVTVILLAGETESSIVEDLRALGLMA